MIEVENLSKRYGEKLVAGGLDFVVQPGVVTGFLGPNGVGKTTAMRIVMGIEPPDAGAARWGGRPLTHADRLVFRHMPEQWGLYPTMRRRSFAQAEGRGIGLIDPATWRRRVTVARAGGAEQLATLDGGRGGSAIHTSEGRAHRWEKTAQGNHWTIRDQHVTLLVISATATPVRSLRMPGTGRQAGQSRPLRPPLASRADLRPAPLAQVASPAGPRLCPAIGAAS
jgi:energy-coupling factor transporter ATP-binding protein EcfA2